MTVRRSLILRAASESRPIVVLYAAGRQGQTDDLDLANAGLAADERGRIAVGPDYRTAVATIPEISYVGRTEEELTDAAVPYEVGISRYRELARGQILGDTYGC
jgi:NAD(P) transhydrogenase